MPDSGLLSAARGADAIQRAGLLHPANESRRVQTFLHLQRLYGNRFVQRVVAQPAIQTKLEIGPPGDIYEQEADRVAERIMTMPDPAVPKQLAGDDQEKLTHTKPVAPQITRLVQKQPEEEETELQAKAALGQARHVGPDLESRIKVMKGGGQPLPASTRTFFECRFGRDFGHIRIHADTQAAEASKAVNARAFTLGANIAFGWGQYRPNTVAGRMLLAHELTHTLQQGQGGIHGRSWPAWPGCDRQDRTCRSTWIHREATPGKVPEEPEIDYARAERDNIRWSHRLGWDDRLADFRSEWNDLWKARSYDAFAAAIAAFQIAQGFQEKAIDGILGSRTWDRVRPIGEVVAKQGVAWSDSLSVCYEATRERLIKGYKRATGESLVPKENLSAFRLILRSNPTLLKDAGIGEEYWGTCAAGALVYLGKGEFVSQDDIWSQKALRPGAVLQVWRQKSYFDGIKRGESPPPISGTSAVFVKYVGDNAVRVLHFAGAETWSKTKYGFWIGANLLRR